MKAIPKIELFSLATLGILLILMGGCEKQTIETYPVFTPTIPTVSTAAASNITQTTTTSGGKVTSDGGAAVTSKGVCWGTSKNPTTAGFHIASNSRSGTFSSNITGLAPNTLYYVRAYATNIVGTAYGNQVTFTTKNPVSAVFTDSVTNITTSSATCGGYVTSDSATNVIVRGVCWSTKANPTTSDAHTTDGSGSGNFTSALMGLTANTSYYVRAYAMNNTGTAYGNQVSFTTLTVLTVTTNPMINITETTAAGGGIVLTDGGGAVTARGICWSIAINPTILNNHTTDGGGTGTFTSNVAGLCANSTYYVRAYATNASGTAYGNQLTFSTQQGTGATVTDLDGNVYHTVTIGTQVWMRENLKTIHYSNGDSIPNVIDPVHWLQVRTGAYCNYENDTVIASTYGRLYNGYAALDGRNICPCGWHVPTKDEWTQLFNFLGGFLVAGGALKESGTSHWASPNTGTNSSGFTALACGARIYDGTFDGLLRYVYFRSSSAGNSSQYAWDCSIEYDDNEVWITNSGGLNIGESVRCLKN